MILRSSSSPLRAFAVKVLCITAMMMMMSKSSLSVMIMAVASPLFSSSDSHCSTGVVAFAIPPRKLSSSSSSSSSSSVYTIHSLHSRKTANVPYGATTRRRSATSYHPPKVATLQKLALTDEYVQMKINGDYLLSSSTTTTATSTTDDNSSSSSSSSSSTNNTSSSTTMNDVNNYGDEKNYQGLIATTTTTISARENPTAFSSSSSPIIVGEMNQPRNTQIKNHQNNSNSNTNNVLRTKFLQPFLSGRMALSTVQSLARVAGAGAGDMGGLLNSNNSFDNDDINSNNLMNSRREDDYDSSSSSNNNNNYRYNNDENGNNTNKLQGITKNVNKDNTANMDGFNKGAFGIANVLSHRRGGVSSNSRTQLIQWQRESLRDVRREIWDRANTSASIVATTSDGQGTIIEQGRGWNTKNEDGVGKEDTNNRMTPLVGILQQRATARRRGKHTKNNKSNDKKQDQTTISAALKTIENDMAILDVLASLQPQLSGTEVGLLLGAIIVSGVGPIFFPGTSVTEVLAPAAAAFTASITIGSEYIGRVAVADGKEIAANTIQCAAEAEALLANAERVKAITPLCVGVGATCASFALLTPAIIDVLNIGNSVIMIAELYLLCPLVSVLAAAVANLALEETRGYASQAINVGVRRFSKRTAVGRTWLSSVEQIQRASASKTDRWWSFAGSVLPAPIIGSIVGGPSLSAKCIVVAALAAAQSAYFLAQAEGVLARATDAVALKARSAAVCDTYANQGARNSAILPFTSALSAFCAAATAATVELPFIDTISSLYGTVGEVVVVSTFPLLSSAFAAAAAVSKARCEVDAEAAAQAASTLALEYMDGSGDDPVLRPFREVRELVRLAVTSGWRSIKKGVLNPFENIWRVGRRAIMGFRWRVRSNRRGGGLPT